MSTPKKSDKDWYVDAGPVSKYLKDHEILEIPNMSKTHLASVRRGEVKKVTIAFVDRVCLSSSEGADLMNILYPMKMIDVLYPVLDKED